VCSATDTHWAGIARAIGAPALAQDPRFATRAARLQDREAVDARIGDFTRNRPVDELLALIGAAEVPVGPVLRPEAVPDDPVLRASGSVEAYGPAAVVRVPIRVQAIDGGPRPGTPRAPQAVPDAGTMSAPMQF
jgi:formyl-CoA transferase